MLFVSFSICSKACKGFVVFKEISTFFLFACGMTSVKFKLCGCSSLGHCLFLLLVVTSIGFRRPTISLICAFILLVFFALISPDLLVMVSVCPSKD